MISKLTNNNVFKAKNASAKKYDQKKQMKGEVV